MDEGDIVRGVRFTIGQPPDTITCTIDGGTATYVVVTGALIVTSALGLSVKLACAVLLTPLSLTIRLVTLLLGQYKIHIQLIDILLVSSSDCLA